MCNRPATLDLMSFLVPLPNYMSDSVRINEEARAEAAGARSAPFLAGLNYHYVT